jgi:hypothetical protein
MQCLGITKNGTQCSRKATTGNYCWQHVQKINLKLEDSKSESSEIKNNFDIIQNSEQNSEQNLESNISVSIQKYTIEELLSYTIVNKIFQIYVQSLNLQISGFFKFLDYYFYGLQFVPIEILGIQISNIAELYLYIFKLSLAFYIQNNTKIPIETTLKKFNLTSEFYNQLKKVLIYQNRCIDPKIFIRSNLPILSIKELNLLTESDFEKLFNIMGISIPDPDVDFWLSTGKYTYGFDNTLLYYFNTKYNFGEIAKGEEHRLHLYRRYVQLLYQYIADPGLNMQIIKPIHIHSVTEYHILKTSILFLNDKEIREWVKTHKLWRQKNIGIDIFAHTELSKYQNYSSTYINTNCRDSADEEISKENRIIIKSFNFAVPLEVNIAVHRKVYNYQGMPNLIYEGIGDPKDYIYTETSLMSTSINFEGYEIESSKDIHSTLYSFYVLVGTICLPSYIISHENELIFPPGTQYILYEKKIYNNVSKHYIGIIIT